MNQPIFPLSHLRQFSADGQVYRAFNYLVAARMGTLLLVPLHLVAGQCDGVVDGCPVPWEEVHAVLEYPRGHSIKDVSFTGRLLISLTRFAALGLEPDDCEADLISPMVKGNEKVLRLVHPCGVRYAVVME